MPLSRIATDWEVFARDGEVAVGAVREVHRDHLVVHIENHGEVELTADQIDHADEGKVVLALDRLSDDLRTAISHAHDGELPDVAERDDEEEES